MRSADLTRPTTSAEQEPAAFERGLHVRNGHLASLEARKVMQ